MIKRKAKLLHTDGLSWIAVRSMARSEKKVHEFLNTQFPCYLPLRPSLKTYKNHSEEYQIPMIPGYVFCQCSIDDHEQIKTYRHVAKLLVPEKDLELQLIEELKNLRIFEKEIATGDIVIRPEINTGSKVRIKTGAMAGLEAIVENWKNKTRITVNVEFIGQSITLEMDALDLELEY
ncbi:MAG: hypothetical protein HRT89_15165 [Lentisphaeria bacterium]|nr:hypothetical protein [Lentisphaeria bacterium]NQZ69396.1 hypothetical protein [Lentisphaeria bacterium]